MISRIIFAILILNQFLYGQESYTISGVVTSQGDPVPYANVYLETTSFGTISNVEGFYEIKNVPENVYAVVASMNGFETIKKQETINNDTTLNFNLEIDLLDEIVITGTRTFKRKNDAAVIVNILNSENLNAFQACNLSDGLKFQPGLRVETDCQTCNYTQLRINGLGGGYSQILINGRPIFSPLTGLYGLEQIPTNMIERIEVIRGGGSSLYGSSAFFLFVLRRSDGII